MAEAARWSQGRGNETLSISVRGDERSVAPKCVGHVDEPGGPLTRHPPYGLSGDEMEGCVYPGLVFVAAIVLAAAAAVTTSDARAADAGNGKRLADSHCASCHVVAARGRNEVAAAPPFDVIGRKYGFDAGAIAHAIAAPHPKMNFSPQPSEAADVAAYIATLGK